MLNPQTSTEYVVLALLVIGLGFALFSSPNANAVVSSVEKKYLGAASGTIATMRVVGQMFSMGIVTLVFALMLGQVQISPERHDQLLASINTSFIVNFTAMSRRHLPLTQKRQSPDRIGWKSMGQTRLILKLPSILRL